ncbi:MAG: efflux transporter periplasmic adaptor subunit [Waddliaceae bacterium]|nr:efflux transporter periplasmic adaptor subunit [Waddliaceae bacterium]|tara:strand:+ start:901 stop:2160 length:1260 start_codon:yes stop_codon:yes gene_type:complete
MSGNKNPVLIGISVFVLIALATWMFSGSSMDDHDHREHKETEHDNHAEGEEGHGNSHSGENGYNEQEKRVHISHEQQQEFGIGVDQAKSRDLRVHLDLSGEVAFNADKVAHIVPRVPGIVLEVKKALGDTVQVGDVLAVLESRELANAKAKYLAAKERRRLNQIDLEREKLLWEKKISSEQEYLNAKSVFAEANIEEVVAEQELHALGLSRNDLEGLLSQHDENLTRYKIVAPIHGVITEKHITIGEKISGDDQPFTLADTKHLWVDFTLYQKDLLAVRKGQEVIISPHENGVYAQGTIEWISSFLDESTRTATARAIIDNKDGLFFPGMFVSGKVSVDQVTVDLAVKKTGIQKVKDQLVVFVQDGEEFEPHPVKLGREDHTHIEVISGLFPGQQYVYKNSFTLKAELEKDSFGGGHAH